jgi:hypothetical protein
MNTFFQLWDRTTGNLVTEFASEDEAIEALSAIQADDGDEPLLEYALFRFQDGRPTLVAKERDLVVHVASAQRRRHNQITAIQS